MTGVHPPGPTDRAAGARGTRRRIAMVGSHVGRHRFAWGLGSIALVGLAIRIIYVATVGRHLSFGLDAIWYQFQAGTIAGGKGYVDPSVSFQTGARVPTAIFPPLWPGLLALGRVIGLDNATGHQVVGAFVGTVTVGLTGLLGRRVAGARIGLLAAALVAVSPMLIGADGSLMSESLYVALVTAALLACYRAIDRPTAMRFALIGVFLGLATLTRSDGIFLVPLLAGFTAWRVRPATTGHRLALGLCTVGLVVVLLAPWTVRNAARLHAVIPLSNNSGSVLVAANCASTYGGPLLGTWDASCAPPNPEGLSEVDRAAADRAIGIDFARAHVGRLPLVVAARSLRAWGLWSPSQLTRLEAIESRNQTWQLWGWGFGLVTLVLAVPGTVLLARRRAVLAPLAAVVVGVTATAMTAYGSQRFALAAGPIVAIAAATALAQVTMGRNLRG